MLHRSKTLAAFELDYARRRTRALSYEDALAIFEGLWAEAQALNPDFPSSWREDMGPDLAVARAINGLPPKP